MTKRTAIIAFTDGGYTLARKLGLNAEIFFNKAVKVKPLMGKLFRDCDNIIFISATGIAVRYIAEHVKHKDCDPAVIVMDERGRFVISLLSGHLGGANELAEKLSKKINATAVITTASDAYGVKSIDLFARENDFEIEDIKTIAAVMARIVEGRKIAVVNTTEVNYPYDNIVRLDEEPEAVLVIGYESIKSTVPVTYLRPKCLSVGIGCKRGKSCGEIFSVLSKLFADRGCSMKSIHHIASIDLKADERGLLELADKLKVPFKTYTADKLLEVKGNFKGSDFVRETVGVDSVSSRAAMVDAKRLLIDKYAEDGITVSVALI